MGIAPSSKATTLVRSSDGPRLEASQKKTRGRPKVQWALAENNEGSEAKGVHVGEGGGATKPTIRVPESHQLEPPSNQVASTSAESALHLQANKSRLRNAAPARATEPGTNGRPNLHRYLLRFGSKLRELLDLLLLPWCDRHAWQ